MPRELFRHPRLILRQHVGGEDAVGKQHAITDGGSSDSKHSADTVTPTSPSGPSVARGHPTHGAAEPLGQSGGGHCAGPVTLSESLAALRTKSSGPEKSKEP
jgi:hypothetical protein